MLEMIVRIVEEGVERGLAEARGEWEEASDEQIAEIVKQSVVDVFHDYFDFDDDVV